MTKAASWTDTWVKDAKVWDHVNETPYTSWWRGGADSDPSDETRERGPYSEVPRNIGEETYEDLARSFIDKLVPVAAQMPDHARNPGFTKEDFDAPEMRATPPEDGTPIVGVIDDGIALSHSQYLDADGGTRILAAWQQDAPWGAAMGLADLPDGVQGKLPGWDGVQSSLPIGNELFQNDIDALRAYHTTGGQVDEDDFNRAAGLVDMHHPMGQRALNYREAHGSHVASLAGGNDSTGLIFVNLPSRRQVGLSGTFIEQLLAMGILRIIQLADKLWRDAGYTRQDGATKGYPIVINMSFSKMAGGRETLTQLGSFINQINEVREDTHWSRVYFVFPTGNDNLLQGVGSVDIPAGEARTVHLDVPPEDQSSSYVEIWTRAPAAGWDAGTPPIKIDVAVPGAEPAQPVLGPNGHFRDLTQGGATLARIFASDVNKNTMARGQMPRNMPAEPEGPDGSAIRQRYLLALAPSAARDAVAAECPAGRWTITLHNSSGQRQRVKIAVQSDQSALPTGGTARRPKLVDPAYQRFDDSGRIVDSYDPITGDDTDTDAAKGLVFRHGTLNALAAASVFATRTIPQRSTIPCVLIVSGYRQSDGRPADYASTGFRASGASVYDPAAAFPTDDGAAVFGVLGAGAREGSRVAYRGSSFAAAQATRRMAELLRGLGAGHKADPIAVIKAEAKAADPDRNRDQLSAKIGHGRHPRVAPALGQDIDRRGVRV